MIQFECTSCSQSIKAKYEYAGKTCKCPKCGTPIKIPTKLETPAKPEHFQEQPQQETMAIQPPDSQQSDQQPEQTPPAEESMDQEFDQTPQTQQPDAFQEQTQTPPPTPPTSYQPPANVTYAGFWKRFAAVFIDNIILKIVITPLSLGICFGLAFAMRAAGIDQNIIFIAGQAINFSIAIIVSLLYFALMHSSSKQATLGKMALGIKVTDLNGNKISFMRAAGRYLSKILSYIILMIGFMMAGWTKKKQALHDMVASTLVVNKK